jgi:uncharacterized protein (DUF488 family)
MRLAPRTLFTLGHSHHTLEHLLQLLRMHGVEVIADVRSVPYSRIVPQFNREQFRQDLQQADVRYVFLGEELGARRAEVECYDAQGRVQFDRVVRQPAFQRGVERLHNGMARYRVALLCAEREPLECHRSLLICRHLSETVSAIAHIGDAGQLEMHEETECRLRRLHQRLEPDLFTPESQQLAEAYALQNQTIAFVRPSEADGLTSFASAE